VTVWSRDSLTVRVTAAFVLVVALVAAGLGVWLYGTFTGEIARRDDIALLGKLRQVQTLLGRPDAAALVRTQPDIFRDTMSGQENSLVRIVAAGGAVLADVNAAGARYPVPRATGAAPGLDAIAAWQDAYGTPGRVVAGTARLDGQPVTVVVARLYGDRAALFALYRRRIAWAGAAGALAAAVLSALLLRRGLAPLRAIAAHAALVQPATLAQRLDVAALPAELRPLVDAFNAMLARLQDGYARLSGFSADLAHEFRTPVANLLGQTQVMLAQPRTPADYEALLASNVEELERLARMIESILFLARAGRDEVVLARQPLSARAELDRVADFFDGMAEERGLHFVCEGDATVAADPALLRRALANLVSNAVRHAAPDSAIVLAAQATPAEDGVCLSVANAGAPIAPEHIPHVFERFYRADPARGDAHGATGLGLSLVRAIMDLHGGTAGVRCDAGGTTFTLAFPAPRSRASGPAA
jgi:two-component system heavy metal sensor histidine kinase CusS